VVGTGFESASSMTIDATGFEAARHGARENSRAFVMNMRFPAVPIRLNWRLKWLEQKKCFFIGIKGFLYNFKSDTNILLMIRI
jgi:hypothetical protein